LLDEAHKIRKKIVGNRYHFIVGCIPNDHDYCMKIEQSAIYPFFIAYSSAEFVLLYDITKKQSMWKLMQPKSAYQDGSEVGVGIIFSWVGL